MVASSQHDDPSDGDEKSAADPFADETQVFFETDLEGTLHFTGNESPRAGSESHSESAPSKPEVRYFGSYELLHEIARGGMGVVYKARQSTLNRIVAVKVILGGRLASDEQVKRFLVEAEAAANLNHPGIVPVYEFGKHGETHYFSMGFVDGPSLAAKSSDKPLGVQESADLVRQICDAVAYAHGRGVVHRDLKPANILLEHGVEPRITDFGLAKRTDEDSELTKTGAIIGSVFYMPPEQATGSIEDIGPTSDIYALGAILYKLLTGRPPFQAATMVETINQVVTDDPVPPRRLNSRIPRDLETICLKCLQKEPGRRYESAVALSADLERFQQGIPIKARPISRVAHVWRWCGRNKSLAGLSAGLAVALLVGVFTATTFWNKAQSERMRLQDQQKMVQVLSNLVIEKTLDETEERLTPFFRHVEQQLMVASSWGDEGLLDIAHPDELNKLLLPLVAHYPQTSSMMVADDRGREQMLLQLPRQQADSVQRWKCRLLRPDQWGSRAKWLEWTDQEPTPQVSEIDLPDYDPRLRPWFQATLQRAKSNAGQTKKVSTTDAIHWTDPYVFFTTKDLGITASISIDPVDEIKRRVIAADVLLEDITRYTSEKRPTPNGMVMVLTNEQEMIGLPNIARFQTPRQWKSVFLKKPGDLGLTVISDAVGQFSFASQRSLQVRRFDSGEQIWWSGLAPFQLGSSQVLWILVIIPESDLRYGLTKSGELATQWTIDVDNVSSRKIEWEMVDFDKEKHEDIAARASACPKSTPPMLAPRLTSTKLAQRAESSFATRNESSTRNADSDVNSWTQA
jgi:tRNA A-37 threonylcarbamoyl transferase component Bud32